MPHEARDTSLHAAMSVDLPEARESTWTSPQEPAKPGGFGVNELRRGRLPNPAGVLEVGSKFSCSFRGEAALHRRGGGVEVARELELDAIRKAVHECRLRPHELDGALELLPRCPEHVLEYVWQREQARPRIDLDTVDHANASLSADTCASLKHPHAQARRAQVDRGRQPCDTRANHHHV